MGLIKEPGGVDFIITSKPIKGELQKDLSALIAQVKLVIKWKTKKPLIPNQ